MKKHKIKKRLLTVNISEKTFLTLRKMHDENPNFNTSRYVDRIIEKYLSQSGIDDIEMLECVEELEEKVKEKEDKNSFFEREKEKFIVDFEREKEEYNIMVDNRIEELKNKITLIKNRRRSVKL